MNLQEHLLTLVMEECAEIQQAVSKILRFGWDDLRPDDNLTSAIEHLHKEMLDLVAVTEMLADEGKLSIMPNHSRYLDKIEEKKQRVRHYLEYARKRGTLQ